MLSCLVTGGSIYILLRDGPSHIRLYTKYIGRGYTVVLKEKLRKYGLEFKEVNQQPEYGYPLFMSTPQ